MNVLKEDVSDGHKSPKPTIHQSPSMNLEIIQEALGEKNRNKNKNNQVKNTTKQKTKTYKQTNKHQLCLRHQIPSPKKPRKFWPDFHWK